MDWEDSFNPSNAPRILSMRLSTSPSFCSTVINRALALNTMKTATAIASTYIIIIKIQTDNVYMTDTFMIHHPLSKVNRKLSIRKSQQPHFSPLSSIMPRLTNLS